MVWPLIGGLAIGGAGMISSALGQKSANRANLQIAREQMAFQERMSSTAYQRAMGDMRTAGLNPMLAYQQGGASSPGGALATMQNVGAAGVAGGQAGVSSAVASMRNRADLKLLQEQIAKAAAEKKITQRQLQMLDVGFPNPDREGVARGVKRVPAWEATAFQQLLDLTAGTSAKSAQAAVSSRSRLINLILEDLARGRGREATKFLESGKPYWRKK